MRVALNKKNCYSKIIWQQALSSPTILSAPTRSGMGIDDFFSRAYLQAMNELDKEFPGATYDDSLKKFLSRKEKNTKKFTFFIVALITDIMLFLPLHLIHYGLSFEINNFIISFSIYITILISFLAFLCFLCLPERE
jgi:hypothetical protein